MAQAYTPHPLPTPAAPLRALAQLAPGSRGVIAWVDASTPAGRRLLDLGFIPGTDVAVVRRAPLGDPVEYELRGCRVCLRRSEAERIQIRPS
jgi:Fe2+ transport system protein FeoA